MLSRKRKKNNVIFERLLTYHISKNTGMRYHLKKLIGFIAFWIAAGMVLMLFLAHHYLVALIIIGLLLLIGYNFYYCG